MNIATDKTDAWISLGAIADYPNGSITPASLPSGLALAVYRVDDEFFVTADRCTHGGASFAEEGELDGHVVECGWHNGTFDIRTGAALTLPCRTPLMTYTTRVEDGNLLLNPKPKKRARPAADNKP